MYVEDGHVVQLDDDSFDQVLKSNEVWMVEFYAPWCGHCQTLAPEWTKAADALAGIVKVAAVDADAHPSVAQKFGVQGFPTIKVFGANKKAPTDYEGARKAGAIVGEAFKQAKAVAKARLSGKAKPSSRGSGSGSASATGGRGRRAAAKGPGSGEHVVKLTAANFDELVLESPETWMVEFYAPWCGHCKTAAPDYAEAAEQLQGTAKFGAINADEEQELMGRFNVEGFPTFLVFPAGPKTESSAHPYEGMRSTAGFVEGATSEPEEVQEAEVLQLVSQDVYKEVCESDRICLIAFMPNILDDGKAGREDRIDMLKRITTGQITFSAVWTEVGAQPELDAAFGSLDFPTIVALRANKNAFVPYRGPFTYDGFHKFCSKVAQGRSRVTKLSGSMPTLRDIEAWDGEELSMQFEEEFSLDEIMNEEL